MKLKAKNLNGYDFTKDKPLIRSVAIREHCKICVGDITTVRNCRFKGKEVNHCPLYPYRLGNKTGETKLTRQKAIRQYCLWCVDGPAPRVRECPIVDCHLWPYRLGRENQSDEFLPDDD